MADPGHWSGLRELPLHVRFLPNESTGSYVTRLAERNGLSAQHLLDSVGEGKTRVVEPHLTELYLNRPAADRLAKLAGRPLEVLQRALASLGEEYLLADDGTEPLWKWPWTAKDGYLVRACALCAARRGVTEPAWLMVPDTWHVCTEHARWTDNSRDTRWPWIDLRAWPLVLDADRRLARLRQRTGSVGRALVADAFAMMTHPQVWPVHGRAPHWFTDAADRLGERRSAPLLAYAKAAQVARVLERSERRRLDLDLTRDQYLRWRTQATAELGWEFSAVLAAWMTQHGVVRARGGTLRTASRGRRLMEPHTAIRPLDSITQLSCLPGDLGSGSFDRPFL